MVSLRDDNNISLERSESFAVRIVNLYKYLTSEKSEYVMSKQILKAGTSIGANLAEAQYAISSDDFTAKLYISLKETSETLYWLRLLYRTDYIRENEFNSLYDDCLWQCYILQVICLFEFNNFLYSYFGK